MGIGLASESGEILDNLKKFLAYGRPVDKANILEEAGDLLFYLTKLLDTIGHTIEDARVSNVAKLKTRYPGGFTEHSALNRNKDAERAAYEAVHTGATEEGSRGASS